MTQLLVGATPQQVNTNSDQNLPVILVNQSGSESINLNQNQNMQPVEETFVLPPLSAYVADPGQSIWATTVSGNAANLWVAAKQFPAYFSAETVITAGTVTISGTPTVNVGNTPSVTVASGTVNVGSITSGTVTFTNSNINVQNVANTVIATATQQFMAVSAQMVNNGTTGTFPLNSFSYPPGTNSSNYNTAIVSIQTIAGYLTGNVSLVDGNGQTVLKLILTPDPFTVTGQGTCILPLAFGALGGSAAAIKVQNMSTVYFTVDIILTQEVLPIGYGFGSVALVAQNSSNVPVVLTADSSNNLQVVVENSPAVTITSGTVSISGTPNVAVTNTPSVTISGTPNVTAIPNPATACTGAQVSLSSSMASWFGPTSGTIYIDTITIEVDVTAVTTKDTLRIQTAAGQIIWDSQVNASYHIAFTIPFPHKLQVASGASGCIEIVSGPNLSAVGVIGFGMSWSTIL